MKVLGIDYGRRRVGVAVSDPDGIVVRGLSTIDRRRTPDIIPSLLQLLETENPDVVAIGLPLGADDQDTPMSLEIRAFAERLRRASGRAVELIDESFTSAQAEQLLRTRKRKQRRNKEAVDRIAACLITEACLRLKVDGA
ncbi:MAG: Holliday junction resolvase RuvX [Chitinivibrionales bacterium]|nr:Holliday junction resolvase RuvX [Chitinivibrionales bacterium]